MRRAYLTTLISALLLGTLPQTATASCSGQDCCYKGTTKHKKTCYLAPRYDNLSFPNAKADGAKRGKVQVQYKKKGDYRTYYGLAKNGKIVIKPRCRRDLFAVHDNILYCPLDKGAELINWNGKVLTEFSKTIRLPGVPYDSGYEHRSKVMSASGGIIVQGDIGDGVRTYYIKPSTADMVDLGTSGLLMSQPPNEKYATMHAQANINRKRYLGPITSIVGIATDETVSMAGLDEPLPIFVPLNADGAPVILPDGVIGVFDHDVLDIGFGFGVAFMIEDQRQYAFATGTALSVLNDIATAPRYRRVARRTKGDRPLSFVEKHEIQPDTLAQTFDGKWVALNPLATRQTLGVSADSLTVMASALNAGVEAREELIVENTHRARDERLTASQQRKDDLGACIAGVYQAVQQSGWTTVPKSIAQWAVRAEYYLDRAHIDALPDRNRWHDCSTYTQAGQKPAGSLFTAIDPEGFLTVAESIPDYLDGPNIVRHNLTKMGAAGQASADRKLVKLLWEDRYAGDTRGANTNGLLAAYSRMAQRGEGEGFYGLASIQHRRMTGGYTNEPEALNYLDQIAYLRPLYLRAANKGYQPGTDAVRTLDREAERAEGFIRSAQALQNYRFRRDQWLKCHGLIPAQVGTVLECPASMAPPGYAGDHEYVRALVVR